MPALSDRSFAYFPIIGHRAFLTFGGQSFGSGIMANFNAEWQEQAETAGIRGKAPRTSSLAISAFFVRYCVITST